MLILTSSQRNRFSRLAHKLKPVVYIGKAGFTEKILLATDQALEAHELIKIKFIDFKAQKQEISAQLAQDLDAILVRIIGNIAILFRKKKKM